jgi:hypothetical protein
VLLELLGDGAISSAMVRQPSIVALRSPHEDNLDLGEDFFSWPHPMCFGEVLFVVDDTVERATREATSRSHESVRAALTEIGITTTTIAKLGTKARC